MWTIFLLGDLRAFTAETPRLRLHVLRDWEEVLFSIFLFICWVHVSLDWLCVCMLERMAGGKTTVFQISTHFPLPVLLLRIRAELGSTLFNCKLYHFLCLVIILRKTAKLQWQFFFFNLTEIFIIVLIWWGRVCDLVILPEHSKLSLNREKNEAKTITLFSQVYLPDKKVFSICRAHKTFFFINTS
jgi:hypothetical protein